jgi:hypothetical protein
MPADAKSNTPSAAGNIFDITSFSLARASFRRVFRMVN